MARYDSEGIEIREAPVYVTMTDTFLSGWGYAKGKKNRLIFICDNEEEAEIVAGNAQGRPDMNHISITTTLPEYSRARYYTQVKDRESYPRWYREGYFNKKVKE